MEIKWTTKRINQMDVKVGDIVHFYGARFEIISRRDGSDKELNKPYCSAIGKWLDGQVVRGYFGPEKNWNFQGNNNVTLQVEITK